MGLIYQFTNNGDKLCFVDNSNKSLWEGDSISDWISWIIKLEEYNEDWKKTQLGWGLYNNSDPDRKDPNLFWEIQALIYLDPCFGEIIFAISAGGTVIRTDNTALIAASITTPENSNKSKFHDTEGNMFININTIIWDRKDYLDNPINWKNTTGLDSLAHEIGHAYMYIHPLKNLPDSIFYPGDTEVATEKLQNEYWGMYFGNRIRYAIYSKVPGSELYPRVYYGKAESNSNTIDKAWEDYNKLVNGINYVNYIIPKK